MFDWINQHNNELTALANIGTLVVWLFYAQLALNGIIKQRRPRVLINQIKGQDLNAELIIVNMGEHKIYNQLLLAVVSTDDQSYTSAVTDAYIYDDEAPGEITDRTTVQGALDSGNTMNMGTFNQVAQRVSCNTDKLSRWRSLELRLIFFAGSESSVVAARRVFQFREDDNGKRHVSPNALDTTIIHRKWHRPRIRRWLREHG